MNIRGKVSLEKVQELHERYEKRDENGKRLELLKDLAAEVEITSPALRYRFNQIEGKNLPRRQSIDLQVENEALAARVSALEDQIREMVESMKPAKSGSRRAQVVDLLRDGSTLTYAAIAGKLGIPANRVRDCINGMPPGMVRKFPVLLVRSHSIKKRMRLIRYFVLIVV
jgi:DNA-binding Lrp family transcriptional regulator